VLAVGAIKMYSSTEFTYHQIGDVTYQGRDIFSEYASMWYRNLTAIATNIHSQVDGTDAYSLIGILAIKAAAAAAGAYQQRVIII
jgi:hypothetical protein